MILFKVLRRWGSLFFSINELFSNYVFCCSHLLFLTCNQIEDTRELKIHDRTV